MKPLPNLADDTAMLLAGKRSALAKARREATEALRDSYTGMQSASWQTMMDLSRKATAASERLSTLAAIWDELEAAQDEANLAVEQGE